MAKVRKKEYKDINVYDETLNRIRHIYDTFDKVVVSFSGGKDSTAVLNTALVVAREKNRLPLEVVFFDEEAIHPPTIEYVERVMKSKDIDLKWYCLEFKHRNACSNEEPFWYTWDKDKKDLWVRDLPKFAITEHSKFKKGMSFQEFSPYLYDRKNGSVAMLTGIR
ncbi:MAG: phosphoadenosine phosphosulfate reductase family protein, partial [Bacteroidota bacterium]